jgi:hypothetical protein
MAAPNGINTDVLAYGNDLTGLTAHEGLVLHRGRAGQLGDRRTG